ncbi:non-ribosomal peptide synthetase/type I polyketide synthase [Armatimonas sp.]|uniref:non-ribosomal peptide synthetase/type I polyketide synthase n=1 Tax=Armatimonas sp. TaxID=1872638 RepID=UPI00286CF209|nr:non-ribosomal peptide synthetase/type I polyketide synthase [Armatimonas sp.]
MVRQNPELERTAGAITVMLGNEKDYVALRVAYKLGLRGPAMAQNTACSTSLVAIVNAVNALQSYQCDIALAGGVAIYSPQERGYTYVPGSILSPDGNVHAFDEAANGTVFGSGVGVVVLKRLEDALRDNDTIHAVIRGAAINNDGADKAGFTAPSISGQADVIALAQALAGVSAEEISYIETHGTGTQLGDPIEIAGLTRAFRETTEATQFCALGTLKPNVGHLDVASGVAGLIKTILALKHQQLPPAINFHKSNPKIEWATSPFFVNTELRPWSAETRIAGVSSFGFGGTNAHVVVSESPEPIPLPLPSTKEGELLVLSARSEVAVENAAMNLARHLEKHPDLSLTDVAYTLRVGRREFTHRRAVSVTDHAEAIAALTDKKRGAWGKAIESPSLVFLFPGQGSQSCGMGKGLYETSEIYRAAVDECAEILKAPLGLDIRDVIFGDDEDALSQTAITQPALFVIAYASAKFYAAQGITPSAMLGHSLGEYVAAHLSGVFSLKDALTLLAERARLMQSLPAGAMLALRLPEAEAAPLFDNFGLTLAAVNGPKLCVASGTFEQIAALEATGIAGKRLKTSHAFHSAMTEPILEEFERFVASVPRNAPTQPIVSTRTGTWLTAEEAVSPRYWAEQLRHAVRFDDALSVLLTNPSCVFVECGPGRILTTLAKQRPEKPRTLTTDDDPLAQLWAAGVPLPEPTPARRVSLPTYPFERQRYFAEPKQTEITHEINTPMSTQTLTDRKPRLLAEIQETLSDLSGMNASEIAADASFSELGFDSLFLTQAAQALAKQFGVSLAFRQLMEELSTPAALAGYVDGLMAPEAPPSPQPEPTPATFVPHFADPPLVQGRVPRNEAGGFVASGVESLVAQQLAIMQQQLALLSGGMVTAQTVPVAAPELVKLALNIASAPNVPQNQTPEPPRRAGDGGEAPSGGNHGPFRPIQKTATDEFTPQQKAHLAELTAQYLAKTQKSRAYTIQHRKKLSDPRAVAGFKPFWKDLVYPIVAESSKGSQIIDIDGNKYVDMTMGFGLNFFGHGPDFLIEAVKKQLDLGIEVGPQSPLAGPVAEKLCAYVGAERAVFCNTGSEAVMAAVRAARTVTGRDKVVMFSGAYHGVHDEVLVRSNGRGKSFPIAPGIPNSAVSETIILEYGSDEALQTIRQRAGEIAAILVEPVQSRHPDLRPYEFVKTLRALASEHEIAFVFDEIVNGFRLGRRGAAGVYDIEPDMQTFGKILGAGIPIGALTGKAKFLDAFDGGQWEYGDDSFPSVGMTFFAGTFVRNPIAMAAANAVLDRLNADPNIAERISARGEQFGAKLDAILKKWGVPFPLERFRSMFYLNTHGATVGGVLHFHLRLRNVHIWENRPSFLSTEHTDADLEFILDAFEQSCAAMAEGGFLTPPAPVIIPTTPQQREVWLAAHESETASLSYNESIGVHLDGELDTNKLTQSLQNIVERHGALRATFSEDGTTQTIAPSLTLDVPVTETDEAGLAQLQKDEASRPFDLAHGPLLRARLVRIATDRYVLLLTAHHIVCDGWSWAVVLDELAKGMAGKTLPTPYSFVEFAQKPANDSDLAWWKTQLATGALVPLALPTDHARPAVFTYRGDRTHRILPESLIAPLRKFSGKQGATLFATLFTAYETLLRRLTGQSELVIGVPSAGQTTVETDAPLVGHAVNLLPLRVAGNGTFSELLAQRKRQILDAFDHRDCTFGTLVSALNLPRDPSRNSLVSTTFNLERTGGGDLGFVGLSSHMSKAPRVAYQFELGFNLVDDGKTIEVEASYNTDLFFAETITRWLAHFEMLLEGILAQPESEITSLPLLTPMDSAQLASWGDGGKVGRTFAPLATLFAEQAAKTPDAIAVTDGNLSLTYAELKGNADTLATQLRELGVQAGQGVAIELPRSLQTITSVLGILTAGAFYIPIDPTYPDERREWLRRDSGAVAVIGHLPGSSLASPLPVFAPSSPEEGLHRQQELAGVPLSSEGRALGEEGRRLSGGEMAQTAALLYTSGSTGTPKGVKVAQKAIARLVKDADCLEFENQTFLFHSAFAFDATLLEIFGPLLNGGTLVVAPEGPLTLSELGETVRKNNVTTLWLTAGLFHALVDNGLSDFAGVQQLLAGGDVLSAPHVAKAMQALPNTRFFNGYGPTENTTFTCVHTITETDTNGISIPIGKPITGTTIRILDTHHQPCPIGIFGELCTGGDGLAIGYHNDPERTAEKFIEVGGERLYRTGDLARWKSDGTVEFLGRADSQVKIRGNRVELGELEAALCRLPGVHEAAALAPTDIHGSRYLVAYVVGNAEPMALKQALQLALPPYLVPSQIIPIDALPLNASGKVDKAKLSSLPSFVEGGSSKRGTSADGVGFGGKLEALFAEALGLESVAPDDDFFALGGDSLKAIRLFAQIEAQFGKRLPLSALFATPTPAGITARIAPLPATKEQTGEEGTERGTSIQGRWSENEMAARGTLVPINSSGSQTPLFLIHHVQGIVVLYRDLAKHLGDDQPVYALEAAGMDGETLPHESTIAMAEDYARLIQQQQPEGAYRVAGFSSGGIVALEVARALRHAGNVVEFVGMFDSYAPEFHRQNPEFTNPETTAQRLAAHWSMFRKLDGKSQGEYLKGRLGKLKSRLSPTTALVEEPDQAFMEALTHVRQAQEAAIHGHYPEVYEAPVTLFRAQEHGEPWDETLFWGDVLPQLELCDVPGDHHLLIQEPFVQKLAEELTKHLAPPTLRLVKVA